MSFSHLILKYFFTTVSTMLCLTGSFHTVDLNPSWLTTGSLEVDMIKKTALLNCSWSEHNDLLCWLNDN